MKSRTKNKTAPYSIAAGFIKRYLALDGKTISPALVRNYISDLQQAIKGGKITSSDPFAEKIREIQDKLVKFHNANKSAGKLKVTIANREKFESSLQGLGFLPMVVAAAVGKAVEIGAQKLFKKKTESPALKGLGCDCDKAKQKNPAQLKKAILLGFVAADKAPAEKGPDIFRLPGELGKLLGDIQPYKYSIVLTGDSGGGKTELVMQLANAFASTGRQVGAFMLEQGGMESKDTKGAVDRNITAANKPLVHITGEAEKGLESVTAVVDRFPVIIIDSFGKLGLPASRFDELRHKHPKTIWIVIFQQNGEGKTRGGVATDFDTPTLLKVHKVDHTRVNNWVEVKKNRGNSLDRKYLLFKKKTVPL